MKEHLHGRAQKALGFVWLSFCWKIETHTLNAKPIPNLNLTKGLGASHTELERGDTWVAARIDVQRRARIPGS